MLGGNLKGIVKIEHGRVFPKLIYLNVIDCLELRTVEQVLKVLGGSLLDVNLWPNTRDWNSLCQVLREHCPKLQNFTGIEGIPIRKYCDLLQQYGAQVRKVQLEKIRTDIELWKAVLEACPYLQGPSYFSSDGDDLRHIASRLNRRLDFGNVDSGTAHNFRVHLHKFSRVTELWLSGRNPFGYDFLPDLGMPSVELITSWTRFVDFHDETLRKIVRLAPQLKKIDISAERCPNEEMWIQVFAAAINLEVLSVQTWLASKDSSGTVARTINIANAV